MEIEYNPFHLMFKLLNWGHRLSAPTLCCARPLPHTCTDSAFTSTMLGAQTHSHFDAQGVKLLIWITTIFLLLFTFTRRTFISSDSVLWLIRPHTYWKHWHLKKQRRSYTNTNRTNSAQVIHGLLTPSSFCSSSKHSGVWYQYRKDDALVGN